MANSTMVKIYISNNNKIEHRNESVVDAYNAFDHIKDVLPNEVNIDDFFECILPELDSFIGALALIRKIKAEHGSNVINEALKKM